MNAQYFSVLFLHLKTFCIYCMKLFFYPSKGKITIIYIDIDLIPLIFPGTLLNSFVVQLCNVLWLFPTLSYITSLFSCALSFSEAHQLSLALVLILCSFTYFLLVTFFIFFRIYISSTSFQTESTALYNFYEI